MKRFSRRNAAAKLLAEQRRARVVKAIEAKKPVGEIAQELGVNRKTITRDKNKMMNQLQTENRTEFERQREEHIAELEQLRVLVEDQSIKPEKKVELLLGILDRDIRVKGTAAPTRSLSATIDATTDPATMGLYQRFMFETRHLGMAEMEEVFLFARKMRSPVKPGAQPPDSSELWIEDGEPKQLMGDAQ